MSIFEAPDFGSLHVLTSRTIVLALGASNVSSFDVADDGLLRLPRKCNAMVPCIAVKRCVASTLGGPVVLNALLANLPPSSTILVEFPWSNASFEHQRPNYGKC